MKLRRYLVHTVMLLMMLLLAVGSVLQSHIGLADNGDFSRLHPWVSSGPVGFAENWPEEGSEAYALRFYHNVLAYWKLDTPLTSRWVSSVLLLWLPGVLLNALLQSSSVLYLPWVAVGARVAVLAFFFLLLHSLRKRAGGMAPWYMLLIGVPFILMMLDTQYSAYLVSFYQEPASLVGLLAVLLAIGRYFGEEDSRWRPWVVMAALLFLTTAKLSNVHWGVLAGALLVPWGLWRTQRSRLAVHVLLLIVVPSAIPVLQGSVYGTRFVNAYQSVFCGSLTFSEQPGVHLRRLGVPEASRYIGFHGYSAMGEDCMRRYPELMTHRVTASMILHEPSIAWRMLTFAADSMQRTELRHLSKHMLYNDGGERNRWRRVAPPVGASSDVFTTWSRFKEALLPRGGGLLAVLALAILLGAVGLREKRRLTRVLSAAMLLLAVGALADMWMQIFGDGRRDLLKHLYMANMCVDGVLLLLPAWLLAVITQRGLLHRRRHWSDEWRQSGGGVS